MRYVYSCFVLLALAVPGWGADFACFDPGLPLSQQFRYLPSVDPTQVTSPLCGPPITDEVTALAQRALVAQTPAHAGAQCTVMSCYLKVDAGLAVEMTAAEKQAVDDTLAAQKAEQQAYVDEVNSAQCTYASLDDVNTQSAAFRANMDAVINSVTNVATTQAALHTLMDRLVLTMGVKLARCDLAHTKAR